MDLLDLLLDQKTQHKSQSWLPQLKSTLNDLILYERLRRLSKYRQLTSSADFKAILAERLPALTKALCDRDPDQVFWLDFAISCTRVVNPDYAQTLEHLIEQMVGKRQFEQLGIVGRPDLEIRRHDLAGYDVTTARNLLCLAASDSDLAVADSASLVIIQSTLQVNPKRLNVYEGQLALHGNHNCFEYQPYQQDGFVLTSFSNQGNNDYPFATYQGYQISMPDNQTIRYRNNQDDFCCQLSVGERQKLMLDLSPNAIANLVIQHYREVKERKKSNVKHV